MNPTTGDISTARTFPYSYKNTATFTVTASDSGNNCPSTITTITLDLETCSNPRDYQFTESKYVRTYFESKVLGSLFSVSIRRVTLSRTYSIEYAAGAPQRYSINATTGKKYFKSLEYTLSQYHQLRSTTSKEKPFVI